MELFDNKLLGLYGMRRARGVLFAVALIEALLVLAQALFLAWALSEAWERGGSADASGVLSSVAVPLAAFAAAFIARQVLEYARARFMERTAAEAGERLLDELLRHLYEQGPALVRRFGSGSTVTGMVEGIDRVKAYAELSVRKSVDLMVIPVVVAAALLVLDWVSGVIAIAALPVTVMFMRLLGANSRQAAARQHGRYERLSNHFADTMRGFLTLKLFGRTATYGEQVYERSEKLREATLETLKTVTLSSLVLDLLRTFALAAVAIMLGFRLMEGQVGLFPALGVLVLVPEFFAVIRRYSADFHATLEGKNQLKAIDELLHTHVDECSGGAGDRSAGVVAVSAGEKSAELASPPALQLDDVSFSHPGATALALDSVSLAAKGPMKVGIVGASGAGKSTLLDVLAGFVLPSKGTCVLDGVRLSTLKARQWQKSLAYIPQAPHVFNATLRENLVFYNPDADDEQVAQAVGAVGLSSLVSLLDQGLNTVIGQGGRALSGGQAQRVALARALLDENRCTWILDEPTAHLDIETEIELKRRILPLMDGKLVFFATHRLHWMKDMDYLVVLEKGRVVQTGTFGELAAADGAFSRLVSELRGEVDRR